MTDIVPIFRVNLSEGRKIHFYDREYFDRYLKTLKVGRDYELKIQKKFKPRSRKEENFHWRVQCELWGEAKGLRKLEAHYDLLQRFPIIDVDQDTGEIYYKTSRDMNAKEYHIWVFDILMEGMATAGVPCPDPKKIDI